VRDVDHSREVERARQLCGHAQRVGNGRRTTVADGGVERFARAVLLDEERVGFDDPRG